MRTTRTFSRLRAGADGYILKSANPDDLVRAVKATAAGGKVLAPDIATKVVAQMTSGMPAAAQEQVEPLSDRELDVLRLAAQGLTNKAIGVTLNISDRTVQGHLASIFMASWGVKLAHRGGDYGAQARLDPYWKTGESVLRRLRGLPRSIAFVDDPASGRGAGHPLRGRVCAAIAGDEAVGGGSRPRSDAGRADQPPGSRDQPAPSRCWPVPLHPLMTRT